MIPALASLPAKPRRVILHWTAGGGTPSTHDLAHYHYVIAQSGEVFTGVPVEQNMRTLVDGDEYAKHTKGMNSYAVGVALAGMNGAKEGGPYGDHPITEGQMDAACWFVGQLCRAWDLPVSPATVFSHAEAESLHGVKQAGKWDITVLPWDETVSPTEVGEYIRGRVEMFAAQPERQHPSFGVPEAPDVPDPDPISPTEGN